MSAIAESLWLERQASVAVERPPASGVFWHFEAYPSLLLLLWYWGGAVALALFFHWTAGASWLFASCLVGVFAAVLFWTLQPVWHGLTLALRYRLALSRIELLRKLAKCEALLVAYHRWPNGIITYTGVMDIERLLELPPPQRRKKIRNALHGLQRSARWQLEHQLPAVS